MKSSSESRRHVSLNSRRSDAGPASFLAVKMAVLAVVVIGVAYGAYRLVSRLHSRWVAQYVVPDVHAPGVVEVRTTPHITEEQIRDLFGLTNGCNLALIDFDEVRRDVLQREPIIKSLSVTKRLPNSVSIAAEERKPVVRVNYQVEAMKTADGRTRRHDRWDVADSDGVVFRFSRKDSQLLPRIKGPALFLVADCRREQSRKPGRSGISSAARTCRGEEGVAEHFFRWQAQSLHGGKC